MHLVWLEDFIELARTRSFSRAAENRFVTHPAFGRRIKALEQWVGAELVTRTQPVTLTRAGKLFLDAAHNSVDVLYAARAQLQESSAETEKVLRLATGRTLSQTFFPDWYEGIKQHCGVFPVSITTGGAQDVIMKLAAGEADILLIYSSPATRMLIDHQRYESQTIAHELLLPVSAPDKRGKPLYRLDAKAGAMPWLAFSQTLTLRGVLAKHLAELEQKPALKMVYQADSYESIQEMAVRGTGVAWLPQRLVHKDIAEGRLLVVGEQNLRIRFDVSLYRVRGSTNELVNAIWNYAATGAGPR
ncbi:LysR substrate-binding domain-containing protein [Herbaspirillum robiniae]|uniref:LysR family transcriptional regulator n=1 Tax=Herbaspirillum robiniae TaxID=2014887 RepID=A0A246WW85_9BURK|nr:LysR substrate-binding domain-containing protein [Herbaspirillum robiniae]NUU01242.1 LysR family transcriptional regulator [Herbaspirillum robiniae]OWY31349.1 LysR family transcriptional regulator [Herbaspirillum robiniae]